MISGNKKAKLIASAAALAVCCASFTGCASSAGNAQNSNTAEASTSTTVSSSGSTDDINVSKLFEETEAATSTFMTGESGFEILDDQQDEEQVTFYTVTDVENELDRAIYKAQVTLPQGWLLQTNTKEGKFYTSPLGTLMIKAQNFGTDTELTDLDTFADSVAASIAMDNKFYQADTEFGEPQKTTVAGLPAVKYEYTVTAYIFMYDKDDVARVENDDTGTETVPEAKKEVYGKFKDEIYIFYNGTDAYVLLFEAPEGNYDQVKSQFDALKDSFTIAEDGTAGYEAASAFESSYASASESYSIAVSESEKAAAADGE